MEKIMGKEMAIEKQRDILLMQTALKLPLLYQTLVEVYGQEKGRTIYDEIFEANFKKRTAQFAGRDFGDIMMYEIDMFPATAGSCGWRRRKRTASRSGMSIWSAARTSRPRESGACPTRARSSATWTACSGKNIKWPTGSG